VRGREQRARQVEPPPLTDRQLGERPLEVLLGEQAQRGDRDQLVRVEGVDRQQVQRPAGVRGEAGRRAAVGTPADAARRTARGTVRAVVVRDRAGAGGVRDIGQRLPARTD
jgi:hypothetical protein